MVSNAFSTNAVRFRYYFCGGFGSFRGNPFLNIIEHGNICRSKRTQSCVVRVTTKSGWTESARHIRTRNSTDNKNFNIYSTLRSNAAVGKHVFSLIKHNILKYSIFILKLYAKT